MSTTTGSRIRRLVGTALALGVLAGCAGTPGASPSADPTSAPATASDPATASTPAAASTPAETTASESAPAAEDATLALTMATTPLGSILVDGTGMTLYMFTKDAAGMSACEGQCLVNWPPLLGVPTEGPGVDDSKLGSFTRTDGSVQATYNGWPLYYWIKDAAPGDTTGQNVQGVWYVLDSDCDPIK